jgi:hypothetical protein
MWAAWKTDKIYMDDKNILSAALVGMRRVILPEDYLRSYSARPVMKIALNIRIISLNASIAAAGAGESSAL